MIMLTKTYMQNDGGLSIRVEYDLKTNTAERIISAWTFKIGSRSVTLLDEILIKEFDLDKKVGEINWYKLYREQTGRRERAA